MAIPVFRSFMPTVVRWVNSAWRDSFRIIVDNTTGAPIGLVSQNSNGPEGIWAPTPLSTAQILAPTATILADLNATYQLDEAPYSRYYSDGSQLVPFSGEGGIVIPPGVNEIYFSPFVVTEDHPVRVEGGLRVIE